MQHHNIESFLVGRELTICDVEPNSEACKDHNFKVLVGHGRPQDMSPKDSFEACHKYRSMYPQPEPFGISNDRKFVDGLNHYNWEEAQWELIEELSDRYYHAEISNADIADLRTKSRNSLSRGDAVAILLRSHFKNYHGHEELESEEDFTNRLKADGPTIIEALYCHTLGTTVYFGF